MRSHWISVVLASVLALGSATARAQTVSDQLEKAIYQEKTAGDLDAAIKIYQGIIDQEKAGRPAMAQAYYRIGLCLAKKGEKDKAIEALQTVVKNYSDQKTLAASAQKELEKLGANGGKPVELVRRAVGKKVADFPKEVDLSTPESACAAFNRALASMDAKPITDLSWSAKADPRRMQEELNRAKADPEGLKIYQQGLLDATIVEVLQYGDDLVQVTNLLQFPEGKGRQPYSARTFGRIDGKWKNLGEDRLPSAEAARENFDKKKDNLREHFEQIKQDLGVTTRPASNLRNNRHLLDQETREALEHFDQSFRGYFRPETMYESASKEKRADMVKTWMEAAKSRDFDRRTRAIAALGNVRAKEAVPVLMDIVNEEMGNQRPKWMAVRALGRIGDPVAIPAFIELVDYGNKNVQVYARAGLADITGVYFGGDKEAWRKWWTQQGGKLSPPNQLSSGTPEAESSGPHRDLLDPETRRALQDFDQSFASYFGPETAYESAPKEKRAGMVKRWMEAAKSKDFDRRTRAIAALGNVRAKEAVPVLMDIVNEEMGNQRPKWMAVRALGRIGDPAAVPAFIELVDYGNKNVQVYARAGLADITGVYFGDNKEQWRQWWKDHGEKIPETNSQESKADSSK